MIKLIKKLFGTKPYISKIDQFIAEFDKSHPEKSASQQQEIAKYNRIFYLRDHVSEAEKNTLWQNF